MTGEPLRQRLRIETYAVHERLHQHPQFAAIADGTIPARDFDRLMSRMGGFYAALDPLMVMASQGAGHGGYRYHPRVGMFPRTETTRPSLPAILDVAALAGAAYVVDGSVLGGQLLRRAINGRLQHPYWDWCADVGPSVWRSTRALIDRVEAGPNSDRAVETANSVFNAFSDHMHMADDGVLA